MEKTNDPVQKRRMRNRAIVVGSAMAIFIVAVIFRICYVQIVQADWLVEKAAKVWNKNSILQPTRGMILDRNGERLAYNAKAYTITAQPKLIDDPVNTARKLATVINMSEQRIYQLITKDADQVELGPGGRKVSEEVLDKVKELELAGISSIEETVRFYPNSAFAAHLIGFINAEGTGVTGMEMMYDEELKGKEGKISYITDGRRREIPAGVKSYEPAEDGKNIVLTIDQNIQHFVERALDAAIEIHHPKNITAVVADPKTGEILALANRPHFNLNQIKAEDSAHIYQNYAVSQFEPGSTFKIITMAAALEEKLVDLQDTVVDNGSITVTGTKINTWNRVGFGEISYMEAFQRSSNVAFVKLGLENLGEQKLFQYIDKFGFGKKTGIELPSEMAGNIFAGKKVYPIEVATTSFGQGISVTPLQQVQAVSAIANGGKLLQMTLIKEISRREGKQDVIYQKNPVTVLDTVISERTSQLMKDAMENLVASGSGGKSMIEGYRIAGKTGTAQKVDRETGRYSDTKYVASFIGFAPVDDPQLVVYVAVDEPNSSDIYGSTVSAPIFRDIMQDSLHYLGVQAGDSGDVPKVEKYNMVQMDSYVGKFTTESLLQAEKQKLEAEVLGSGNYVVKQSVAASEYVPQGTKVYFVAGTENGEVAPSAKVVPDLTGMSKGEVIELLRLLEMDYRFEGEGFVIDQSVEPSSPYSDGTEINIIFRPQSMPVLNPSPDE